MKLFEGFGYLKKKKRKIVNRLKWNELVLRFAP